MLDLPDLDLERSLLTLLDDVQLAVPSFVGLSMTLLVEGQPVTLTSVDRDAVAEPLGSSLRLPLTLTAAVAHGSTLVLYATAPGAFVDLAADLGYATSAFEGSVRIDQDLVPSATRSGVTGIAELSMINRAIGLLIGRGLTPAAARSHLQERADQSHVAVFQIAAFMISMTE